MAKLNFILFNMSRYAEWQNSGVVNRNYHMLHQLAKDPRVNKIIAVDFLQLNFQRAVKVIVMDQLLNDRRGEVIFGNLTSQAWRVTSKITVFSTIDSLFRPEKVIQDLRKIIEIEEMSENLIVWNYNPLWTGYFGQLGQRINIFDGVDNWLEHSSYQKMRPVLEKNYSEIADKSDLIFAVSDSLAKTISLEKAKWLPNAVDPEHFSSGAGSKVLDAYPRPRIGFLGILQDRIDTDLIKFLSTAHPNKSFILAGPVWKNFPADEFKSLPNVFFIGPVSYADMPAVYKSFDVGIIPYKVNAFIKSTNSMKFYEYLSAGLPVVSTRSGGVDEFAEIIRVADTAEDFSRQIDISISENNAELRQQRIDFVKKMTWEERINTVISDIEPLL